MSLPAMVLFLMSLPVSNTLPAAVAPPPSATNSARSDTTNATDGFGGDIATNGSLLSVTPRAMGADPPMQALLNLGIRA